MSNRPLIGVDAVAVGTRTTGAARFLLNLLAHLPAADPGLDYLALVSAAGEGGVRARAPGVDTRVVPRPRRGVVWELRGAARAVAAEGVDLLLTVRELVPLGRVPVLVHVFEPPAYRLGTFGRPTLRQARRYAKDVVLHLAFKRSLRRARAVTAGSRTTADWLRTHVGIEAGVVLPGIDAAFLGEDPEPATRPPYVLHLAAGDARDNTDLVLRALASDQCRGVQLVVVGTPEDARAALERRGAELAVDLDLAGWVTDDRLRELYRGAVAVAHPTKYEGFAGYPALEAMSLGTPVIALDAPGAAEALAGRGILLPREDPALLADAVSQLRDDSELRARLSAQGREFARSLTWDATAARFAEELRRALERDR
jgi:glycosyltransferase involved in cell wall biosynthesis